MKRPLNETTSLQSAQIAGLLKDLEAIRREMYALEESRAIRGNGISPRLRQSVANLLHYLALRRHDIRPLQVQLASLGISSLGRAEAAVLPNLENILRILRCLQGEAYDSAHQSNDTVTAGRKILEDNSETLFGPCSSQRDVHIMVTMPSEAASDYLLVRELVANGMNCMRINCVHDGPEDWERMIEHLRRARRELGKKCRVLMDLGGPKLRTGPVDNACDVLKISPCRDRFGKVMEPARILLRSAESDTVTHSEADVILLVEGAWLKRLQAGDTFSLTDARKAHRTFAVTEKNDGGIRAECPQSCYLAPNIPLVRIGTTKPTKVATRVLKVVTGDPFLLLHQGDMLNVTRDLAPGTPARHDRRCKMISPASIGCTLPEVFSDVRSGDRIWFDDGKIAGIIRSANSDLLKVEIISTTPSGEKLRGEKGINLPDSRLKISCLTAKDEEDLKFIVNHAHMVGMSFVQDVSDIHRLQRMVADLGAPKIGVILKIETRRGFEMLPDLLLAAMRSHAAGVMIARGDLAVECGFERLAEVQEEILWLCEAAHIPVIWATQVLESLAKTGVPSRAEITDAAMGERAECVMLNKGPHIIAAIRVLDNILQRMSGHQHKKSSMMRQLRWWENVHISSSLQTVES